MGEALEIRTGHRDVSAIVKELAPYVDDVCIRLPVDRVIADGEWVSFSVALADGTIVFEGLGRAQGVVAGRIALSLLQFDDRNEIMYERVLLARDDAEGVPTGTIDLNQIASRELELRDSPPEMPARPKPPAPSSSPSPAAQRPPPPLPKSRADAEAERRRAAREEAARAARLRRSKSEWPARPSPERSELPPRPASSAPASSAPASSAPASSAPASSAPASSAPASSAPAGAGAPPSPNPERAKPPPQPPKSQAPPQPPKSQAPPRPPKSPEPPKSQAPPRPPRSQAPPRPSAPSARPAAASPSSLPPRSGSPSPASSGVAAAVAERASSSVPGPAPLPAEASAHLEAAPDANWQPGGETVAESGRDSRAERRARARVSVPLDEALPVSPVATLDTVVSRPADRDADGGPLRLTISASLVARARTLGPNLPAGVLPRTQTRIEEKVLRAALHIGLASLAALADAEDDDG